MHGVDFEAMFFEPEPLEEVAEDCLIVLDTNVLYGLVIYRGTFSIDLTRELTALAAQRRLLLPARVIQEFGWGLPSVLREALRSISDAEANLKHSPSDAVRRLKNLRSLDESRYDRLVDLRGRYDQLSNDIKRELQEIRKMVIGLFAKPWGLEELKPLFTGAHWHDFSPEEEVGFIAEAESRYRQRIPPGYGDRAKADGGLGDYVIWKSILKIGETQRRDLVFVTDERKEDWFELDEKKHPVCPRRYLVEEYYRESGGHTIHIIDPRTFIDRLLPVLAPKASAAPPEQKHAFVEAIESSSASEDSASAPPKPLREEDLFVEGTTYETGGYHGWEIIKAWEGSGAFATDWFEMRDVWYINCMSHSGHGADPGIAVTQDEDGRLTKVTTDAVRQLRNGEIDVFPPGRFRLDIHPKDPCHQWKVSIALFLGH
ncbi:MAG: hypothetical protein FJ279_10680 [Planctomycetes bacterium]|nr:hypothetical protein [Planctomycetota bacterium]